MLADPGFKDAGARLQCEASRGTPAEAPGRRRRAHVQDLTPPARRRGGQLVLEARWLGALPRAAPPPPAVQAEVHMGAGEPPGVGVLTRLSACASCSRASCARWRVSCSLPSECA